MLPMTDEVYECFAQIVKNRKKVRVEPIIDGYSRFLFLDKKDIPEVALQYLMGHSDIGVTLNVCTHLGLIDAKEEMNRIAKLA